MIVLLPIGATEAHGPHLPLDTDTLIAAELARRCQARLGWHARVEEPFTATAAAYARDFEGTVHVDPAEESRALVERVRGIRADRVVLVNLHFDPEHMRAVKDAVAQLPNVVWPNFTRRAHAQAIGAEFATGACHGGEFETSLMLVAAPERVKPLYRALPEVRVDLARAIRDGKRSFREAGVHEAYCGHPATATREEGERLYAVLADIVLREVAAAPPAP
ncbi:MAG TPA: creatininase family protein [Candidatus Thermoplasmatota archaeon]|nr:creatininase family protein [Candidatus Thermoplasmatota archaeon]